MIRKLEKMLLVLRFSFDVGISKHQQTNSIVRWGYSGDRIKLPVMIKWRKLLGGRLLHTIGLLHDEDDCRNTILPYMIKTIE